MSKVAEEVLAWSDEMPGRVSCLFCDWAYEGSMREGRGAARAHRLEAHPEAARKKRRYVPNPARITRPSLSEEDRELVERERQRRARLHGLDMSGLGADT
jgi:hypothetical protein